MLRHYRREGVSDPVAAHIDAGGDGDAEHAYSRHRPIRKAGLIRHAGRGHYTYAVPDLIREAYADRLDEPAVRETVREVETAFVPPAEREYPPDAGPEAVDAASEAVDTGCEAVDTGSETSEHDENAETTPYTGELSEAAHRIAERGVDGDE